MTMQIDEKASVTISKDLLSAFITFKRPEGGELLTYDQLLAILDNAHVTFGIDHEELKRLAGNPDKKYDVSITIASGEAPENGQNAKVDFKFKIVRDKTPKVLPDGSVDHHILDFAESVHKGDVLAEIKKETEGRPGKNVFGFEMLAKPGRPLPLLVGKNTELTEDGLQLIASSDGMVNIVGSRITVIPVLEIIGDIGPTTGHITFSGDVKIKGNVLTGYNVSAEGSVHIVGCIEASEVRADGDIIIEHGVKGLTPAKLPGGVLYAKGNITSKFIEGAIITALGTIRADSILNSTVKSYSSIIISGKKGNITGGLTYALEEIICEYIGSNSGKKTYLMSGLINDELENYRRNEKSDQRTAIENAIEKKHSGRIVVNKTAYPPLEITINKATAQYLVEEFYNTTFRVKGGDIFASPNY